MTKVSKGAGKKPAPKNDARGIQTVVTLSGTPGPITYRASSTEVPLGANPKDLVGSKKPPLSLVPPSALVYTALAMKNGCDKYGRANWRSNSVVATIYIDAALRHMMAWLDGEEVAEDSGVPHLGHALATLAILVDAHEGGNLIDDRPKPGPGPASIKKFSKA